MPGTEVGSPPRHRKTARRQSVIRLMVAIALLPVSGAPLVAQGVTTGGINGVVLQVSGEPVVGATITAVHGPSGTTYSSISRDGGVFTIPNMRVGGPYTVAVSSLGFAADEQTDVFISLGQNTRVDFALRIQAVALEGIEVGVTRDDVLNADRTGAQTIISRDLVSSLPSIKRSVRDVSRTDPRNDGNYAFGGRNWLYNSITVDGTYANNTFGLDDPAPGGQTDSEPIPFDAIDQVHVAIAPFDVRQSGFTGGSVNTVTKSGTNEWAGSLYSYLRNDGLQGNTVSGVEIPALDASKHQTGFTIGGPLRRDKLFIFVSGEIERRDDPGTNYVANTDGTQSIGESRVRASVMQSIRTRMIEEYGYDPGSWQDYSLATDNDKLLVKLNWNISPNHNLVARYNYLDARRDLPPHPFVLSFLDSGRGPNESSLPFENSGYTINNELNSFGLELNSRGSNWSNRFFASLNRSRDFRDAKSTPFPTIEIGEGGVTYTTVGHEPFSIENNLDTDTWQFTNDFTVFSGRHSITAGANFELYKFFNSFNIFRHGLFGLPFAATTFFSLDDFFAATDPSNPNQIDFTGMIGSGPYKGEKFNIGQIGIYVQDQWVASPRLTLTAGLRVDLPRYFTDPVANPYSRSLNLLDENDDPVTLDQADLSSVALWSPRLGFNWDAHGDRSTQVRGGTGLFSGRPPFVWAGNVYSNPGANPNIGSPPVVTSGPRPGSDGENFVLQQSFDLNGMVPDFKWPQLWQTNVAVDHQLPGGLIGTAEVIYGRDVNAIVMRNYDLVTPQRTLPDGRPYFGGFGANELNNAGAGDGVYVIDNVGEGWNYTITGQLRRFWAAGHSLSASYTFLDARNNLKSTEIASVLFQQQPVQGDPNNPGLSYSEFGPRHRFVLSGSYVRPWSDRLRTTIGFFFEAAQGNTFRGAGGNRYSFTYSGDVNGDGSGGNDLIYIPRSQNEIRLDNPSQWAALNAFIEQDDYLSQHRGEIAERFGLINPWYQTLDLRVLQDIAVPGSTGNTIQVTMDVLNALNLINSSWGVRKVADARATNPLTLERFDTDGTPVFSFSGVSETFVDSPTIASRWQIQFGLRYLFN